jgi:hypothetical protein
MDMPQRGEDPKEGNDERDDPADHPAGRGRDRVSVLRPGDLLGLRMLRRRQEGRNVLLLI